MSSSLSKEARALLEDHFQADLSTVRVHTGEEACRLNSRLGTWAVTFGEDIFVLESRYAPDRPWGRFLLAHEVAHVLQKRLQRSSLHRRDDGKGCLLPQLEREANDAARSLILGKRCTALSPDPGDCGRAFGPEGHYYTVYFLCLAAGLPVEAAGKLAFYAQIADQISEIDATAVATDWYCTYQKKMMENVALQAWQAQDPIVALLLPQTQSPLDAWLKGYAQPETISMMQSPKDFVFIVQRGLHCLTGGVPAEEEAYRARWLLEKGDINNEPASYGLAIHAFGDSFAHRVIGSETRFLYPTSVGHLLEAQQKPLQSAVELLTIHDATVAHIVDDIGCRPPLYLEYGKKLYGILRKKAPQYRARTEPDNILQAACACRQKEDQTGVLIRAISAMGGRGHLSQFSGDAVTWLNHPSYKNCPNFGSGDLLNALRQAATWARARQISLPAQVDRWMEEKGREFLQRVEDTFTMNWRLAKHTLEIVAHRAESRALAARTTAERQVKDQERNFLELVRRLAAVQTQIQDGLLDDMVALNTITKKIAATRFPDPRLNMQVRNLIQCADDRKRYVANVYRELSKRRPYLDKKLDQAAPGWRNWCQ